MLTTSDSLETSCYCGFRASLRLSIYTSYTDYSVTKSHFRAFISRLSFDLSALSPAVRSLFP